MKRIAGRLTGIKGQTLVETAFALLLLMLFVLGIFEIGRAMYIKNTLTNAARAGARAVVVQQQPPALPLGTSTPCSTFPSDGTCPTSLSNVCFQICNSLFAGIPKNEVTVTMTITDLNTSGTTDAGDSVQVQVAWSSFQPYSILFRSILGQGLSANATMRYE